MSAYNIFQHTIAYINEVSALKCGEYHAKRMALGVASLFIGTFHYEAFPLTFTKHNRRIFRPNCVDRGDQNALKYTRLSTRGYPKGAKLGTWEVLAVADG